MINIIGVAVGSVILAFLVLPIIAGLLGLAVFALGIVSMPVALVLRLLDRSD